MHALEFEDEQLQILDLGISGIEFGLLSDQQGFQRVYIRANRDRVSVSRAWLTASIWPICHSQRITAANIFMSFMFYTATAGTAVRAGLRQSMPSSSIASCARLNDTAPCSARGQMKRPRSRRFANRHRPSPSHHSTLMRSPRLPRKTKTCAGIRILFERGLRDGAQAGESAPQVGHRPAAIQIFVPAGSEIIRADTPTLNAESTNPRCPECTLAPSPFQFESSIFSPCLLWPSTLYAYTRGPFGDNSAFVRVLGFSPAPMRSSWPPPTTPACITCASDAPGSASRHALLGLTLHRLMCPAGAILRRSSFASSFVRAIASRPVLPRSPRTR